MAGGEELEEEEPAAAGEAAELEDAALDAAFDVLVGSDGEAISQSLYGGRRGRPDSTARDFRGLSPESIPRFRHSGSKGPHGAIMLYTLTHAYAIRPRSATLSGHGHARTKAAPPSSSSFNLGVQRYLLIRHELLTLQYGHTSAKTHARTWPHRTGARSQARRASPTRPLVFVAPCPPPRRFVMSRPRRLAPSHLRPSL